jgi:hypothetical protein
MPFTVNFYYDRATDQYLLAANWNEKQCHLGHGCHSHRGLYRGKTTAVCQERNLAHDCPFNLRNDPDILVRDIDTRRFTLCNCGKNGRPPCNNKHCPYAHVGDVVAVMWREVATQNPQHRHVWDRQWYPLRLTVRKRNSPLEANDLIDVVVMYDKFDSWYFEKRFPDAACYEDRLRCLLDGTLQRNDIQHSIVEYIVFSIVDPEPYMVVPHSPVANVADACQSDSNSDAHHTAVTRWTGTRRAPPPTLPVSDEEAADAVLEHLVDECCGCAL